MTTVREQRSARDLIDNGGAEGWPETMDDFYALCTEDDLVTILARGAYSDPFSRYDYTIGEHIRAILKAVRAAAVAEAVARERENAAQIADKWANTRPVEGDDSPAIATIMSETGKAIASAIRSGEEP